MENQTEQPQVKTQNLKPQLISQKAGFVFRWAAYSLDSLIVAFVIEIFSFLTKNLLNINIKTSEVGGAVLLIYFTITTGLYGASFGKKFFKLIIVDEQGNKPGWGKSILREVVGKIISSIVFGLGFAWALWDKNKQTWHDKISGTYVVQTGEVGKGKKFFAYLITFLFPVVVIVGIVAAIVLVSINPAAQIKKAQEARDRQNQYLQQYVTPTENPINY